MEMDTKIPPHISPEVGIPRSVNTLGVITPGLVHLLDIGARAAAEKGLLDG